MISVLYDIAMDTLTIIIDTLPYSFIWNILYFPRLLIDIILFKNKKTKDILSSLKATMVNMKSSTQIFLSLITVYGGLQRIFKMADWNKVIYLYVQYVHVNWSRKNAFSQEQDIYVLSLIKFTFFSPMSPVT